MFHKLLQIFRDFEQYDKGNSKYKYAHMIDPKGGEAPSAFENYKRSKEDWQDEQSRRQRFYDYLMQRRDLVEGLAQSVIDSSAQEIQVKAEQELDKAIKEMADKIIKYYFK